MNSDLAYVLACRYSLDAFILEHRALGFELLPVDLISLVVEILADYHVSSGNVLDGHDDVIESCSAESLGLYEFLISLDDLYTTSLYGFSDLVLSQINYFSVLTDSEGSGPLSVQKISLGRLSFLHKIRSVWKCMSIRRCDAVSIRGDHKGCITLRDFLASNHDCLSRLVVDSEFSTCQCCIALSVVGIQVIIDLGYLDAASLDGIVAFDRFVVSLYMDIVCSIFSDSNFEDLIIDKITFRCFDLLDQISSERIADLTILVLVQGII